MEFRNWPIVPSMACVLSVPATSAMAQVGEIPGRPGPFYYGHEMMWGGSQWGGFGMVLGPIFMILIVVGIVAGIIYLLRLFGATGPVANSHATHDHALALLKERYAKGEIDTAEFTERKKLLSD